MLQLNSVEPTNVRTCIELAGPWPKNRSSVMRKSISRQNAAEYRSLAETARSEELRSLLLNIASEWEALADAASKRSKCRADYSALNPVAPNQPYRVAA